MRFIFSLLLGAVIIFTGINSMIFLKRRPEWFRWLGMVVIVVGLVIVGLADFISPEETVQFQWALNIIR